MDSSGKKLGSKFGTAMKVGAAAAVGGALIVGKFLKDSIAEAREAQKVGALTASTIKATGGAANVTANQVGNLAAAISLKTGIDDEVIQSGQNMLLTFKNIRNETGKGNDIFNQATSTLTDMSAAMGSEPKQAAIQLGKALNDPVKGVSALSRVGVTFTESQKKTIESMVKQNKTAEAQKIVLKELNSEFGGAAAAQATAGEKAAVAFGNLQESVGTALLPLWDRLLEGLTRVAIFLTNNIGPSFRAVNGYIAPLVATVERAFGGGSGMSATLSQTAATLKANFLPVLQTMANTFQTVILPAVLRLATYLRANLVPIFQQVATIVTTQVVPIVASLARFIYGSLYPAVIRIVGAIASKLKPVFDQLFRTIQTQVLPGVQRLLAKFREYQPAIQRIVMQIVSVTGKILIFAAAILGKVLPPVIKFAGFMAGRMYDTIGIVIGVLIKIVSGIIRVGQAFVDAVQAVARFASAVNDKINEADRFIASIPGKAKDALGDLGSVLLGAGEQLIQGLIDGITNKIGEAVDKVRSGLSQIRDMLPGSPIKSGPLTSWNNGGAGKRLIQMGLIDGIDSQRAGVNAAMTRLTGGIRYSGAGYSGGAVGAGGGRVALTITNWDEGTGFIEAVADGRIHGAGQLAGETARAM